MRFINKEDAIFQVKGRSRIDQYLNEAWNNDENRYFGVVYEKGNVKEFIKDILIEEQANYCCYCMKQIEKINSTIEHVIPRNCPSVEFAEYQRNYVCLDSSKVIEINEEPNAVLITPPYPHQIAYENMLASCSGHIKGNKCCNSQRGNAMIIPFFFISEISERIKYSKLGYVYDLSNDSEYTKTIKTLNLNDPTLVEIRLLWKVIAKKFNDDKPVVVNIANAIKYIATTISNEMSNRYDKYTQSEYLKIFKSYSWFKDYYSKA